MEQPTINPPIPPLQYALSASSLLERGMESEAEGNLSSAREHYRQAIAKDATLGRAHFHLGNVLLELGDNEGALAAFLDAISCKPDSAAAHYNAGTACLHLKRLQEALEHFERATALKPDFVDSTVSTGVALQEMGRLDESIAAYRSALAINPQYAEVYFNLSGALLAQGNQIEAIETLRHGIENKRDYFDAYVRLGTILGELRQFGEANEVLAQALTIRADSTEALLLRAAALGEGGDKDAAVEYYRRVAELANIDAELLSNMGVSITKLGKPEDSLDFFSQALALSPETAEIHSNLGVALKKLGRFEESIASYQQALILKPDFPEVLNNIGTVQHKLGRVAEAEMNYRKALALQPTNADIHNNIGSLCQNLGKLEEAALSYRRSLECDPSYVDAYSNLGAVLAELGHLSEAVDYYQKALELDPGYAIAHSNLLFTRNYTAEQSSPFLLAEAKKFGKMVACKAARFSDWAVFPQPDRRLKIGVVSADFRQHPVGYFAENALNALAANAKAGLHLVAFSNHPQQDEFTKRIRAAFSEWHDVYGLSDHQLAELIHAEKIDILIDLSGHTAENRLPVFAWKPAPIQVTWLGYFATTGVAEIDYLIADPWTLPLEEEKYFSETIWRLPETRLCFTPPPFLLNVTPPPALVNNHITFGCFNNLSKMNDDVVALWAQVLNTVPNSRLYLKARALGEVAIQQSVIKRFAEHDIDPQRLTLETYVPRANYLEAYNQIDIALDPFPYTGGTTTAEALWMGVPVLTLAGKRFLARQGVGLLMNAGLPEWVASDQDDYLSRAVAHASDLQRLASLRARLRQQVLASPIFDAPRFARHFEAALRCIWEEWCGLQ